MTTLYQQFREHLLRNGCSLSDSASAVPDHEIWINDETGTAFNVPTIMGAKSNLDIIAQQAGIPPYEYEQH